MRQAENRSLKTLDTCICVEPISSYPYLRIEAGVLQNAAAEDPFDRLGPGFFPEPAAGFS
jgi:hypothetical protein